MLFGEPLLLGTHCYARARPLQPLPLARCLRPQATAVWQWSNYLCAQVPPGRRPLLVNFDETAVCLFQGDTKGNVFVGSSAAQRASRTQRRTYLTYVAFVCDDPLLQPLLPQVIIANTHTMTLGDAAALRARSPPNVVVLRRKSAWIDQALCAEVVHWLRDALAPYLIDRQPILMFDACRVHVSRTSRSAWAGGGGGGRGGWRREGEGATR